MLLHLKSCHLRWSGSPRCLTVSVCGGDPTEDFEEQEELGLHDDTMDLSDPTRLGREVRAALATEGDGRGLSK